MNTKVIGLFSHTKAAGATITALEKHGVPTKNISLITSENIDKNSFEITENTKLPQAAGVGAATGGALGLIVGGLTAIGSVATGGVGLLASGPVVASLTAGAFGAGGGGILGAVLGSVIPESEHQKIVDELEKGSALICVDCQAQNQTQVIELLKSQQAKRVVVTGASELEKLKGH